MLDPVHARNRQQRLLAEMQARRLDALVVGAPEHVYYLSTHRTHVLQQSAFVLWADGRSWLVGANDPAKRVAADEAVAYVANPMGTQRQEQPEMVAGRVVVNPRAGRCRSEKKAGLERARLKVLAT